MIPLLASLAFACPNIDAEVERATSALIAGDFTNARTALQEAEASFACAAATPTQIARFWLVEGATAHLRAETATARVSLAAARATAPTLFDDRLGPEVRATWAAAEPAGSGSLVLEPRRAAFIDGEGVTTWPLTVSAAPHVVQVVGADGSVRFGRVVRIGAGEDAMVETNLGNEPEVLAGAQAPKEARAKKSPAMLILAGVAAAGAGAFAGGALAQNAQMEAAEDLGALDSTFGRQKAFGYTSYGLMGATAAMLTLHFVIK
ncbi:MAG: hypothetical protein Q7U06_01745 [Pseudomonadota bacterium]|nr:hypothetical protein [Pseudomonadota bacterium]